MTPSRDGRSRSPDAGGSRRPGYGPRRVAADGCPATLAGSRRGRHDCWPDSGHAALPPCQRPASQRRVWRRAGCTSAGSGRKLCRCGPATALQELGCGAAGARPGSATRPHSAGRSPRHVQEVVHLAGRRPGAGCDIGPGSARTGSAVCAPPRRPAALPRPRPVPGRAAPPAPAAGRAAALAPRCGLRPAAHGRRTAGRGRHATASSSAAPRRRHLRHHRQRARMSSCTRRRIAPTNTKRVATRFMSSPMICFDVCFRNGEKLQCRATLLPDDQHLIDVREQFAPDGPLDRLPGKRILVYRLDDVEPSRPFDHRQGSPCSG